MSPPPMKFWVIAVPFLDLALLISSQSCTDKDFTVLYDGVTQFSVSSTNGTCFCQQYRSYGSSTIGGGLTVQGAAGLDLKGGPLNVADGQTVSVGSSGTASRLNVYGAGYIYGGLGVTGGATVSSGGLAVSAGGVTVSNGQTVNVGTTGSSTPLNVYGATSLYSGLSVAGGATVSNGLSVLSGGVTVSNGQTVNVGTSGNTSQLNVFGNAVVTGSMQVQKIFVFVDAINDYVSTLPYFTSEWSAPYPKVVSVACGTAARFPSPSIVSANEWDWGTQEAWTLYPTPPAVYSRNATAWARITISLTSNPHHAPCFFLRREYCPNINTACTAYSAGWTKLAGDPDISLGCLPHSKRSYMASVFVWAPWWTTALPGCTGGCGFMTQRLLVSAETDYCPDQVGNHAWQINSMTIDLHASESGKAQPTDSFTAGVTPPGYAQFSTNPVASGTPRNDSPVHSV
eukprot:TRINITY_DN810_c0_g3_i2.p1 TRINITY_DN810_c0_g3~~TRINITY_DN810_c0_g3_i2.p1  ORF type:complete len:456 (+),score=109.31 TRINITY_DN810_c0_g3_i2:637-2004(+)